MAKELRLLVLLGALALCASIPVTPITAETANATVSDSLSPAIVLWHGMGDTCCLPMSMGYIQKLIQKAVPGSYVRSIMIGSSEGQDEYNGFLMPIATQLEKACDIVKKDLRLQNGFHAVGFSQGGLFLRALVQTCDEARVINLISIGGPQQGVFGAPRCMGTNMALCGTMRTLLEMGAYMPFVQDRLVQAQYWHDPAKPQRYINENVFLPAINNEKTVKDPTYKTRLASLNKFVMVKFMEDTMVIPRESTWFGFYKEDGKTIATLQATTMYKEDWLGLKMLADAGKLIFLESPGDHLEMPPGYFEKNIIPLLQ